MLPEERMCVHSSWNPWELLPSVTEVTENDKFGVFSPQLV